MIKLNKKIMLGKLYSIFIFVSILFLLNPTDVFAITNQASFADINASLFAYDNTKIEFSGGTARLKPDTTWYNASWNWREVITVSNPTIFQSTSTEVKINITSSNTDFWNHIESDGRSLRFTSSDGTTLTNYYLESFDYVGQTATVYVVVPSISRQASTSLYMYFGNTGATSQSSATSTFYFSETFTGASVDTTKYTIIDANSVFSQNGTQLLAAAYEGGSSWHSLYASTTLYTVSPSSGLVFEADFSTTNVANKDQNTLIGLKNDSVESLSTFFTSMKYHIYINGGYNASCLNYSIRYNSDGTNTADSGYDIACDTTYNLRFVVHPSNGADYFIKGGAFTNWTYLGHSTFNYTSPMVFALIKQEGQATIDNIRIRHSTITATSDGNSFPRYDTASLPTAVDYSEPSVIYENGIFKMWYSTVAAPFSTGYTTSSDGITWSTGSVVLAPSGVNGTFDKSVASRAEVVKVDGVYYMYYNGFEVDQTGVGRIGLATSTDGVNWNRYANNPILTTSTGSDWQSGSLYNTAVIKVGSVWYMLYEGRGTSANRIGLATSTDGITWTKYSGNPVITNGLSGLGDGYAAAPNLIYVNGVFYTWFLYMPGDGTYRMARAYSTDAITWTKYGLPELSPRDAWEYISVSDPSSPVEVNGSVYMYYIGGNQAGIGATGLLKYNGTLSSLVTSSTPFLFSSTTYPYRDLTESQGSIGSNYSSSSPSLVSPGVSYDKITAFTATSSGSGSITYQISNNGSTWYYWNGSAWAIATLSSHSNSSTVINANITSFSDAHPSGTFYWKAFFVSDGTQSAILSALSSVTNIFPSVTVENITGTKSSSVTVNYSVIDPDNDTINFSQTATSGIEYSLNGSTWNDATSSSTGDGLTGLTSTSSPGQSHTFIWDSITDASTTESNTVYLRFRPNDGYDFATSWTTSTVFGLDNVAPSNVGAPTFGTISTDSVQVIKPSSVTDGGSLNYWQVRRDLGSLSSLIATSTTSTTVSSLSANTQYTFDVRFIDSVNSTSTFGTSSAIYTAANTPSLLSATVDSATQISLTWSGDATQYYIENTTAGTNSDWQSATQKTFSNLTCNTAYTFRVKGRNGDQVDTDWSSQVSATTRGCGGGSVATIPPSVSNPSMAVSLNSNQSVVSDKNVVLKFAAQNAKQMAISNDPGFAGASWDPYQDSINWNLIPGSGLKTVYVKFRSADGGVSDVYKLSLTLAGNNNSASQGLVVVGPVTQNELNLNIKNSEKYTPGSVLQLSYKYINNTDKTIKVKVTRELLDSKNKIIKTALGKTTLKPGGDFTNNTKEKLPTNLKAGNYSVRIRIYNQQTNKLIVQEIQEMKVIKK